MKRFNQLSKIIPIAIIVLSLLVMAILINFTNPSNKIKVIEKSTNLFQTKQCEIDIYPENEIKINVNQTHTLTAMGYQGSLTQVAWQSKNPRIASFNLYRGDKVKLIAYNPGRTEIIVTDKSMGEDCTDYVFVTIKE